jgi:NAD-dependent DNA ligase
MLSDNVLDQAEQSELLDLLLKVTGEKLEEFSPDNNSTCLPIDNPEPEIDFNGKLFCFTGKFVYGTRAQCQKAVELRGGQCIKSPNKDLNYLIIGSIGSREWIHSTHGRKIEEAVKYRDELQLPIAIVSEYHWTSQIEQA